jgi:uncharacterized damage-inducible protein DinB
MSSNVQTAQSETARITNQLRRMYDGPAWHGPALMELLTAVTPEQAAARPLPSAHNIWELVLHIATWLRVPRERLSATENRDPAPEENWPPITGSWPDALAVLEREQRDLERAILAFPNERLNDPAPGTEPQTFYIMLHGAIQHVAYHAGQIALLQKS